MDISSQLVSEAGFNLDSEEGDENVQQEQRQTLPKSHRKTAHQLLRENIPQIHDETAEHTRHAFELFLENFKEEETNTEFGDERIHNYVEQIKQLRNEDRTTLYIDFEHLSRYDQRLSELIKENYYRFEPYLRQSVQKLVFKYDQEYTAVGINKFDGLLRDADITTKEFWISFYNASDNTFLRKIRTEMIGQLVNIRGTVTRTSEVRPELLFGTFKCLECGQLVKDVEQQFRLTEPSTCGNPTCNNRNNFALQIEKSKFVDWQKVRVQESSEEVPSGAMPRSMDIILRNEIVERAKAGDKVIITGIPIVVPDIGQLIGLNAEARRETYGRGRDGFGSDGVTGLKALGARELTYKIAFLGGFIRSEFDKDSITALHEADENDGIDADDIERSFSEEELNNFRNMRSDPEMNRKLPTAIAPHIFGHENIKKGLLLQLLGGVHKKTKEGIHLRGDINVCIVGDPSTAKSQFLKYVSSFMPRAVYTSGKASSAAGLTATVMKDEETGEFTIEAGALMLADNGICCIDEFDKMNLVDQVAIHEAMEQQTISITKAGIQATLNARTSILAAANPIRGRYDKKLSLKQNINMSPPIMSRFDLFFVVLDECDEAADYNIAQHIVNFHKRQGGEAEEDDQEDITSSLRSSTVSQVDLKHYLRYARALKPQLAPGARELLVDKYRQFRQEDSAGLDKTSYRITVRQLESMVRLSEALAKLDCTKTVEVKHVHEACHLLRSSIVTVDQERFDLEEDVAETGNENIRQGSIGIEDYMAVDKELSPVQVSSNTKIVLEASEYYRIAKAVISKITAHEQSSNEKGIKKSDLVQWYLDEMEDDIESENDLIRERTTIVRVLNRLQKTDGTLLVVQEYDELPQMEDGIVTQNAVDKNPTLTVHPNYADDF